MGLSENTEYYFYPEAAPNKNCGVIFCYIIMMLVQDKNKDRKIIMPLCNVSISSDNKNRLYILKKTEK